ncbi:MAG: helix-turn-helix protein [Pelotomaculum sp. PtaB.Bin104]|nr:MAG: helix-turn-helix protein [Pelotomaculum sp. PtaB.Bin104]
MINLKKYRTTKGLSQVAVAKELKITVRMYQYLESGRRNPSWEVAQRLERFFNVPASELLAEFKEPTNPLG